MPQLIIRLLYRINLKVLSINIIITRDEGIICNDLSKNVDSFSVHGIFISSSWFLKFIEYSKIFNLVLEYFYM